jgi:L-ascorbate metabolism protein UlaG (beta-lactamase superfamily)
MGDLGEIDLAFVPINLPYMMLPEEAVSCIKVISPGVVMPYDPGESDPQVAADALAGSGIEVRVLALP